jgi:hypothetical protein
LLALQASELDTERSRKQSAELLTSQVLQENRMVTKTINN